MNVRIDPQLIKIRMNSIEEPRLTDVHRARLRQSKRVRDLVSHPEVRATIEGILSRPGDRQREAALADAMRRESFRQLYELLVNIAEIPDKDMGKD